MEFECKVVYGKAKKIIQMASGKVEILLNRGMPERGVFL